MATAATASPAPKKVDQLNFAYIRANPGPDVGVFRIMGELFGWKNPRTSKVIQMESHQVNEIEWMRVSSRDFLLVFHTKEGDKTEFIGFRENDFDQLQAYLKKHWKKSILSGKLASKGWHWGEHSLQNKRFCFAVDGKRAFELPFKSLAGVTTSKSDLSVELSQDQKPLAEDAVVEIRFFVPPPKEGDAVEAAELLKSSIMDASGLAGSENDIVCSFPYKQCMMPPGRFDVQFTSAALKLHGKSSGFSVLFTNISSAFMLPSSVGPYTHLLLTLSNPLKKGQTKYPAVIIQMEDKKEVEVTINASDELFNELKAQIPDLKGEMTAIEHLIAGDLLRALSNKSITMPSSFRGSTDHPCFRCSHKITSGHFYPLEKMFVFIPKPVVIVRFDEIASVDFERTQGQQTRLFEFQLTLRNGQEIEFNSIDRAELQPFVDFLQAKNLRIRELTTTFKDDQADMEGDDNEDDDDEEAEVDGEEEDESEDADFEEEDEEE